MAANISSMITGKPTNGSVKIPKRMQRLCPGGITGYQIGGMADRPTLVDNNTWNNTHIATVGKADEFSRRGQLPHYEAA